LYGFCGPPTNTKEWIPAFAGMTTGGDDSGRNGGNDTGKESTHKPESHPQEHFLRVLLYVGGLLD